ncbi:hypothetical protein ABZ354_21955 [Streptomyces sp. NPDC005925]
MDVVAGARTYTSAPSVHGAIELGGTGREQVLGHVRGFPAENPDTHP